MMRAGWVLGVGAALVAAWAVGGAAADERTQDVARGPSLGGVVVGAPAGAGGWEALKATSPRLRVSYQADGRAVKMLTGLDVPTQGGDWEARAQAFLGAWGEAMGLGSVSLALVKVSHMKGLHAVQLQQMHDGLPVYQRFVVVTLTDEGRVRSLSSDAAALGEVARGPVGEDAAKVAAQGAVYRGGLPDGVEAPMGARPVVVADGLGGAVVAWHVQVAALPALTPVDVLVDSRDGRVLLARDGVMR